MEPINIRDTEEWSSIDIFLFSNGQQYSPPRKYHLHAEELQWWQTTIKYLGRTHYGPGHSSIELYTLDGTKINGPLELINGAAYVAVKSPDNFINTGYEEYLLKASRSWEKRLAQKLYNSESQNPDITCDMDSVAQNKTEDNNIHKDLTETASSKVDNNIISPQKSRPIKPYQRLQRKSITTPKQIQKRKSFDTRSNTLKKNFGETEKIFPCPKKTTLKKNESINQKLSPIPQRKLNGTTNQEPLRSYQKRSFIKSEVSPKTEVLKEPNIHRTDLVLKSEAPDLFKTKERKENCDSKKPDSSLKTETLKDPKIHITNLVQEPESIDVLIMNKNDLNLLENNLELNPDAVHHHQQNSLTENDVPVKNEYEHSSETKNTQDFAEPLANNLKEIQEYKQSETTPKYDVLENNIKRDRQENYPINCDCQENKNEDSDLNYISEKQVIDEYVAHMNKGGLLLLKLKIKLKDCKTIFNRDKNKNIPTVTSLSNLPKTEKTSQVDINISFSGELLKSNDQLHGQEKSLQSLLNKLYTDETNYLNSKKPKIIILQCACRDSSNNHKCGKGDTFCECDNPASKPEVILNHKLNETFTTCECRDESFRPSKGEYAVNGTLTPPAKEAKNDRPLTSKANSPCVKDLAQKFENSDRSMLSEIKKNNNNKRNSDNTPTNENHRPPIVATKLIDSSVSDRRCPVRDTKNKLEEKTIDSSLNSYCSRSTQTDWCNVLLEARRDEGDNYTFYLPSLYKLKQYNL